MSFVSVDLLDAFVARVDFYGDRRPDLAGQRNVDRIFFIIVNDLGLIQLGARKFAFRRSARTF